jgi:DNA-binding MarR family transcriptional regulator
MSSSSLPVLPCLCSNFRRTSRALTQLYEKALQPIGLEVTQFTILQALSFTGELTQGRLGKILAMDSTTLTRTLRIVHRHGWIAERRGDDRRQRWLRLSKSGEAQLQRALPLWEKVQSQLRKRIGNEVWQSLFQLTHQMTEIAVTQGESL